jgi:hypothetical protein
MATSLWSVALAALLGQSFGEPIAAYPHDAFAHEGEWPGYSGQGQPAETLYPFDAPQPWVHGYFQEIPAYGGFRAYRPYNYKHLLAQSQVAGGWGMSPTMPYSHEYFRRGRERALIEQRGAGPGGLPSGAIRGLAPPERPPSSGEPTLYDAEARGPAMLRAPTPVDPAVYMRAQPAASGARGPHGSRLTAPRRHIP